MHDIGELQDLLFFLSLSLYFHCAFSLRLNSSSSKLNSRVRVSIIEMIQLIWPRHPHPLLHYERKRRAIFLTPSFLSNSIMCDLIISPSLSLSLQWKLRLFFLTRLHYWVSLSSPISGYRDRIEGWYISVWSSGRDTGYRDRGLPYCGGLQCGRLELEEAHWHTPSGSWGEFLLLLLFPQVLAWAPTFSLSLSPNPHLVRVSSSSSASPPCVPLQGFLGFINMKTFPKRI